MEAEGFGRGLQALTYSCLPLSAQSNSLLQQDVDSAVPESVTEGWALAWLLLHVLLTPCGWVAQGQLCLGLPFVAFLTCPLPCLALYEPHYTMAQRMRLSKWFIKHLFKG